METAWGFFCHSRSRAASREHQSGLDLVSGYAHVFLTSYRCHFLSPGAHV